ncbi:MAG: hypothetical protein AVDCRST_MAG77-3421 [uncultured Chloroflexi bacterium]|uniref:Uncharacterized protein n=1 Tax=uncultured Chloroflexota bacterium TaxID=166587 RepID=A0A6J4J930_9CHLR|nr:MAG: hypothetical protein AVDCRST_MAG77-3421 [uncultured Chloroflexota bacterium]
MHPCRCVSTLYTHVEQGDPHSTRDTANFQASKNYLIAVPAHLVDWAALAAHAQPHRVAGRIPQ